MNIFILSLDPEENAQYHCDKHVGKMIAESAQMLFTASNELRGIKANPLKTKYQTSAYSNHPCTIWVKESYLHRKYLFQLAYYLNHQMIIRNPNRNGLCHQSFYDLMELDKNWENHLEVDWTINQREYIRAIHLWAFAATEDFRKFINEYSTKVDSSEIVSLYQLYYMYSKAPIAEWKYVKTPEWFKPINQITSTKILKKHSKIDSRVL